MFNVLDLQLHHNCPFLPIARGGIAHCTVAIMRHISNTLVRPYSISAKPSLSKLTQGPNMHKCALLQIKETFAGTSSNIAFQPQAAHTFNFKQCNQRFSGQILNPVTNRMESLAKASKANTWSKLLHNLCPLCNFAKPLLLCLAPPTQHPLCVAALIFVWNWLS